jgi:hypothetical protein
VIAVVAKFEGFDLRSECFEQQVVVRVVQFSHYRVVVIKEPELALAMALNLSQKSVALSSSFFVFKY